MRKYVLIPDSFKGTLSSRQVCQIVAEAIRTQEPEAEICAVWPGAGYRHLLSAYRRQKRIHRPLAAVGHRNGADLRLRLL